MYGTKHMARTCPSPLLCPSPFHSTTLRILKVGGSQRNYVTKGLKKFIKSSHTRKPVAILELNSGDLS